VEGQVAGLGGIFHPQAGAHAFADRIALNLFAENLSEWLCAVVEEFKLFSTRQRGGSSSFGSEDELGETCVTKGNQSEVLSSHGWLVDSLGEMTSSDERGSLSLVGGSVSLERGVSVHICMVAERK